MSPRRRPATASAVLIKVQPSVTPSQSAEHQTPTGGMTLMKRKLVARPALVGLVAALATVTASGALAQSVDGALWLECTETSTEGNVGRYDYFRIISENSIVVYYRADSGEIKEITSRRDTISGDICRLDGASCNVDEDAISIRYEMNGRDRDININRRSGYLTVTITHSRPGSSLDGNRIGLLRASCARTTDPRPPAAF